MDVVEAMALARELMNEHDLGHWVLQLDTRATKRFGQCRYSRREIGLAEKLVRLNTRERVQNTVLHEIAHALVGPGKGHGREWKLKAIEVGARPERCYGEDVVLPPAPWYLVCLSCEYRAPRQRRTSSVYSHRRCGRTMQWQRS